MSLKKEDNGWVSLKMPSAICCSTRTLYWSGWDTRFARTKYLFKPSCGTLLSEKRYTAYMMPAQAACVTLTGNMEIPTYGRIPIIKGLPTPTRFSPGSFTPNKWRWSTKYRNHIQNNERIEYFILHSQWSSSTIWGSWKNNSKYSNCINHIL